jgi:hypothetical protein
MKSQPVSCMAVKFNLFDTELQVSENKGFRKKKKISLFWVVAPCSLAEITDISEVLIASVIRDEKIYRYKMDNPVLEKINNYKEKWIQHVHRMDRSRFPRAILNYQPSGKTNQGRPLKRLFDL